MTDLEADLKIAQARIKELEAQLTTAEYNLCQDNIRCCDDDCQRCANLIYQKYMDQQEELMFIRQFVLEHGLQYQLVGQWNKRATRRQNGWRADNG